MPDHFSLKLRIKSVVMLPVGLLLFFKLQSTNLFCFLTPASFHRHISICGDTKNCALVNLIDPCIQVVSRQKLNSYRENIVLYSINLDVFSIAIEYLTTNDLDSVYVNVRNILPRTVPEKR